MSHVEQYFTTYNRDGVEHRFSILEEGGSAGSSRLVSASDFFRARIELAQPRDYFNKPAQSRDLQYDVRIETQAQLTFFEGLVGSEQDKYQIKYEKDSSHECTVYMQTDMVEIPVGPLPKTIKLRGKDLTYLKSQQYSLTVGRDTIISVIADILSNTGLSLQLKTMPSFDNKNIDTSSDDWMNLISLDRGLIREPADSDSESDQTYNQHFVLQQLCRNFGLILRQENGAWYLRNVTELANDPLSIFTYDSSGSQLSAAEVDIDAFVGSDLKMLPTGTELWQAGLKRVTSTFDHRTKRHIFHIPSRVTVTPAANKDFEMDFFSDGNQSIEMSFEIEADGTGSEAEVTARVEIRAGETGNFYYLDNSGESLKWESSQTYYEIELDGNKVDPNGPGFDDDKTIDSSGLWFTINRVSITPDRAPSIPADADGTFRVRFASAIDHNATQLSETRYFNIDFNIVTGDDEGDSDSIGYYIESPRNFAESYDIGETWFGDGPAAFAKSALTYSSGIKDVPTKDDWRRIGGTAEIKYHKLLMREIMDTHRTPTKFIKAHLWGDLETYEIVNYDGDRFMILGGDYEGHEGRWNVWLMRINVIADDDTIGIIIDDPDDFSGGGGGGGGGEDPSAVGEITSALSGTFSSDPDHIPVEVYSGKSIESGKDYFIYNLPKKRPISFTALEDLDVGKYNLDIQEQRIVAPSGSKIYKEEGQKETERLIQVEQQTATESARASLSLSVKNERQDTAIGTTTSELSGTITSIPLENIPFQIKLEDGDTLTLLDVVDDNEGANEDVTVNGNQTLTAGTGTVTVNSVALSNTYPIGSTLFEPAAGLTSRISLVSEVTTSNSSSIASLETDVSALESTLVLKAEVTSGDVTKLAFVRLDASAASGSAITMSADLININGVVFDSDGVMYSSNFDGGITSGTVDGIGTIGWAMDRNGDLYANSATLRKPNIEDPDFTGTAVGLINIVSTKANLPASGAEDGDTYYVEDEPGGLYVWRSSNSTWENTRNGGFLLKDSISAGKIQVATLSAIAADIGVANISDTLTMGASGEITNSTGDYTIDGDGIQLNDDGVGANALQFWKAGTRYGLFYDSGSLITLSTSFGHGINLSANDQLKLNANNNILIDSSGGDVDIQALGTATSIGINATNNVQIDHGGQFILPDLPTSNPGGANNVWNDSGTLKIT